VKLIRVSKRHPCSICGDTSWCSFREDMTLAICMRREEGSIKATKDGKGWVHLLDGAPRTRAE
jgi:hypothetical protein